MKGIAPAVGRDEGKRQPVRRIDFLRSLLYVLGVGLTGIRPVSAEPMTCATCRQPITGRYVQFGRKVYHPNHLLCAACGEPLDPRQFMEHQGQPYHPKCYAESFAERCAICHKPIMGRYIKKDGHSYHEECYRNKLAEKCAVCGGGLVGKFFIDPWGNKYHAAHQSQCPNCEYCGRVISPATTGGGYTYGDGRSICMLCYKTQISGNAKARPLVEEVRAKLAEWGIEVPASAAPVNLVDRGTLRNLLRRTGHPGGPNVNGFTSVLTEKQGNHIVKREMGVYVLYGMPKELFMGTLAHELIHVWINLNNGRKLDYAFEEGSCNYFKYLMHTHSDGDLAAYAVKSMQQDPDPAYGAGFRRAKRYVDSKGLPNLITLLQRSTNFPLGY
jgi:hypothetical protein